VGGIALVEALKSNTTLKTLESAALPSNPPAHALRPHSMHARCTGPLHLFLRHLRSLSGNNFAFKGFMALKVLKSSSTRRELKLSGTMFGRLLPLRDSASETRI